MFSYSYNVKSAKVTVKAAILPGMSGYKKCCSNDYHTYALFY